MDPLQRAEIAEFFSRPAGETLLDFLDFMCPELLEAGTNEQILVRSGKVAGSKAQLKVLLQLISPDPETPKDTTAAAYPSLDDEKSWETPKQ
jgi:hypothetical protein